MSLETPSLNFLLSSFQSLSTYRQQPLSDYDENEYKLYQLLTHVLFPSVQSEFEKHIREKFGPNVQEFFKKNKSQINNKNHLTKVKYILIDYDKANNNNNNYPNDFQMFDMNALRNIAFNIDIQDKPKYGWTRNRFDDYSDNDFKSFNLSDKLNYAKILKSTFFDRTSNITVDDSYFNYFNKHLNKLLDVLDISDEILKKRKEILNKVHLSNARFNNINLLKSGKMSNIFKVKDSKYDDKEYI